MFSVGSILQYGAISFLSWGRAPSMIRFGSMTKFEGVAYFILRTISWPVSFRAISIYVGIITWYCFFFTMLIAIMLFSDVCQSPKSTSDADATYVSNHWLNIYHCYNDLCLKFILFKFYMILPQFSMFLKVWSIFIHKHKIIFYCKKIRF